MEQKRGGNYDSVITLIDWEGYKALALEMLQEAGVQLLLHTDVVSVCKEDDCVHDVVVQNKSGREAICAKVVIDTTGDADVAALIGLRSRKATPDNQCRNAVQYAACRYEAARCLSGG